MPHIALIDNYDSFSFNLVQAFRGFGAHVSVFRNDTQTIEAVLNTRPDAIVLSPGPGHPSEAGICIDLVKRTIGQLPILGVCLGHQCITQAMGGAVVAAQRIMHGKQSKLQHDKRGLFADCPNEMQAGRYHSLVADTSALPDCLRIIATADDGEIMAIQHDTTDTFGLQFHPESVLTPHGPTVLKNFLSIAEASNERTI